MSSFCWNYKNASKMKVFREIVLTLNIQCYQPLVQRNFDCVGENTLWKFATPTVFELDKKCRVKVINSRIRNGLKFLILLIKINKKRHWKNARKKVFGVSGQKSLVLEPNCNRFEVLEFELILNPICSIRTCSRDWDIFEKQLQLKDDVAFQCSQGQN